METEAPTVEKSQVTEQPVVVPVAPTVTTADVPSSADPVGTSIPTPDTSDTAAQAEALLEDMEWDGTADLLSIPHATKFPKLFQSLATPKAKAEDNELFDRLLNKEPDELTQKELKELREFKAEVEKERAAFKESEAQQTWEKELEAQVPDIFNYAGDEGNYPALERYLQLIHDKGLEPDEAAVLVRAKWKLEKPAETEEEAPSTVPEPEETPAEEDEEEPVEEKPLPKSIQAMSRPGARPNTPTVEIAENTSWESAFAKLQRRGPKSP